MRTDWIPIRFNPREAGTYLVATHNGAVRLDRWDGESWGLSLPRTATKYRNRGRYKPHIAWTTLPKAPRKEDLE